MQINRVIHPVGQGAFYSEHFILGNRNEVNVLYDCGAKSPWKYALDREIGNFYAGKNNVIDVLFISHFDEDHVNGIYELVNTRKLTVNKVILPILKKEKWLRITEYGIEYYQGYLNVLNAFRQSGTQLIFVNPVIGRQEHNFETYTLDKLGEGHISDNESNDDANIDNIIDNSKHINSGDRIKIADESIEWIYIPIYFDTLLNLRDKVKNAIEQIPYGDKTLKVEDLEKNIGNLPLDILKQINEAYISVIHDNNKPSMLCYSGPEQNDNFSIKSYDCFYRYCWNYHWLYDHCSRIVEYHLRKRMIATLYTGDSTLKREQCNQIASKLSKKDKKGNVFLNLVPHIGILQLPHHGSKYNITLSSVEKYIGIDYRFLITFASFGLGNSYGHPAPQLIGNLSKKKAIFFEVNEIPCTRLEDEIII